MRIGGHSQQAFDRNNLGSNEKQKPQQIKAI
jgi:hypothetical protein